MLHNFRATVGSDNGMLGNLEFLHRFVITSGCYIMRIRVPLTVSVLTPAIILVVFFLVHLGSMQPGHDWHETLVMTASSEIVDGVEIAAVARLADEEDEGEQGENDPEDEEEQAEGPSGWDRLWDAPKLG